MNRLSRSTLLLAVTCASFALIGSQEAQADTAITDIECLTDESGETVACYQFFRLDFDGDDPDSRDWAFSKTAAEDQRCDTRTECFGGNGFLATIVDEDQNEFLRQMARDAQHAGNFPQDSETVKQCWVGGQKDPAWHGKGTNGGVWGHWIRNAGPIPDNNVSDDFADWGRYRANPNEPNFSNNAEFELGWNRYGVNDDAIGSFNDEGSGLGQMFCYIAQFGPIAPGPSQPVVTVGAQASADVVESLNTASFQCELTLPAHRPHWKSLRLDKLVKQAAHTNPACAELASQLPKKSKAILPWWLRASDPDRRIVVSLITTSLPGGGSAEGALSGPVNIEYDSGDVPLPDCTIGGLTVPAPDSPVTAGIDYANKTYLGRLLFIENDLCNRPRSKQKFSPVLTALPLSAVANKYWYLPAADARVLQTIIRLRREGEVNRAFLNEVRRRYVAASRLAQQGNYQGVYDLEDVIRFIFRQDPNDGFGDPYAGVDNNPLGALAADILPTPFIADRYRLNPDGNVVPYEQPFDIRCELLPLLFVDTDTGGFCEAGPPPIL